MEIAKYKMALENYCPELTRQEDFFPFWENEIKKSNELSLQTEMNLLDYPLSQVKVYDVTFQGVNGVQIHGWYMVPDFIAEKKYPCLVCYHGYGGSRGVPSDHMLWILAGMAVFAVDCRGQGGITGDSGCASGGGIYGLTCRGILEKEDYYYREVYLDCIRSLDVIWSRNEIDRDKIVLYGISQGGGLAMAVASLDNRPAMVLADVPGNSDLERRVEGEHGSFGAVSNYLKYYPHNEQKVYKTLSYFDTMNMAERMKCPVHASVALKDVTCPAECYFASYNRITVKKTIDLYPYNGHENAYGVHMEKKLAYLKEEHII